MAVRLLLSCPPKPPSRTQNHSPSPNARFPLSFESRNFSDWCFIRRGLAVSVVSLTLALTLGSSPPGALSEAPPPPSRNPVLAGIANTKSWFQFYGDGFSIRVPPLFEDVMEPEVMIPTFRRANLAAV
ncbi:hypothetical protein B296_00031089 [Ensete ventricosum]|uniref:Uncharacterized protein n=1 Tax=Ensete ventricosum TaxID=4639 RepID=A0A426Y1P6_ENSVE|nr:hypothetical protein B296_00031089 [Ensete ventricosum]